METQQQLRGILMEVLGVVLSSCLGKDKQTNKKKNESQSSAGSLLLKSELSLEIPIIQNALFMCSEQRSDGTELRQSLR